MDMSVNAPSGTTAPHLIVWYNTRCPVCDAGIDRQRNKLIAAAEASERDDFLRIVISLYLYSWSMIFSENRYLLFGIML
jgi:hypothetical protein